jgi:hypothetical protein
MNWSCATCAHLDKSRKKQSDKNPSCYLYGCNHRKGGYVCGWCRADKELNLQGCSDFKPITAEARPAQQKPSPKPTRPESVQLSIFDLI